MTVIFFGSSEFSLAALKACLDSGHKVLTVITTPDKGKGRGLKETPNPVRLFCQGHGLPVEAPGTLKEQNLIQKMGALKPELFVVSSYGKIIPSPWLALPTRVALNVHPSLLPLYRGAAPVNWPLLNGDRETGVSIAEVTSELDAGDLFCQIRFPLDEGMDAVNLSKRLAELSAKALQQVFNDLAAGGLERKPQGSARATYARKLTKEDGCLDWKRSSVDIHNQIRGLLPWPATTTQAGEDPLIVLHSQVESKEGRGQPGELLAADRQGFLRVQTGLGVLHLDRVKPAGKREMSGCDYANGRRLQPGFVFGAA